MAAQDRDKALDAALAQIERQFGRGSVMRLGDSARAPVEVIPTGSIALDVALGIGGLPRGRIVEVYGPEASGKTTVALHAVASAQRAGGIAAFIDAEHALDPDYARKLGVDTDALLVSQPDTGEQALEIADMLIRSGALDIIVIDSVAALVPRAEIEGEMGDSHVGLQARLMSQALRKVAGALNQSKTTAVFINQLREKVGVLFGCLSYGTRVTLVDGTQEKIGKIVNQRMPVEVLSYDPDQDKIVPKKVVNWFNNGRTDEFLQITVTRPGGNGRAQMGLTRNHLVRTPEGWREAGELRIYDQVMISQAYRLSDMQMQVILGSLMGDGTLTKSRVAGGLGTRFRMGHGAEQVDYVNWKASLLGNIGQSRYVNSKEAVFVDCQALPELAGLHDEVYIAGKKVLSWDYLKRLTPLALAIWYMDDGTFSLRAKGVQQRTRDGSGRSEICVQALSEDSRYRLIEHLEGEFDIRPKPIVRAGKAVLVFPKDETAKLHALVAPYVHPSMEYKLLPRYRGRFSVEPEFVEPVLKPTPARVIDIHVKPKTGSMNRFDIEVEGSHNYLADGIIVHNSPETTTGGRALKFYASVRLDVRRIESLKDGTDAVGNRTRVKVVKNKNAAPFRQAEFDILYGLGISREGGLIDMGVEHGIVRKSGAWYTYEGDQLGQGKENARTFLRDNPDLANEVEKKIKEKLGIGARLDDPSGEEVVPPISDASVTALPDAKGARGADKPPGRSASRAPSRSAARQPAPASAKTTQTAGQAPGQALGSAETPGQQPRRPSSPPPSSPAGPSPANQGSVDF